MAFRAVRDEIAAEMKAGSTVKLSWLKHFGGEAVPTVSYTHFADLVAREITGKASSPSAKAAICSGAQSKCGGRAIKGGF